MAGPWEKYANPAVGYGADPYKVAEEQRKIADQQMQREASSRAAGAADRAATAAENAISNSAAANNLAERKFQYEQSRRNDAPLTAKDRADAIVEYNKAIQLRKTIDDLVGKYRAGPGSTSGVTGVGDFFPTQNNSAFDSAANKLRGSVKATQGFTGGEGNTMSEVKMNIGPFIPSSWEYDQTTEDKLDELYNQSDNAVERTVALLGGVPDQYGNVSQQPASKAVRLPFSGAPVDPQQRDDNPVAVAGQLLGGGAPMTGSPTPEMPGGYVPYGQEYRTTDNPEMAGVNAVVAGMYKAGASQADVESYMRSKGIDPATTNVGEVFGFKKQNPQYGGDYEVNIDDMQVPLSRWEQLQNNIPQTRLGTMAATALNAGGMGIPQMLAGGEGLDYLRSQNPSSAFAGDVAGVIGGTAALGKIGTAAAGKFAPKLLGGGSKGMFGRQLATDATYGGIYGGTTEGDPLTGALTATAGSLGGQAIGKGLQKTFAGGGDIAAQAMRDRGIPVTLGQAMGGMAKRIEDGATSIPLIGDIISNRRMEGLQAFNRAAFQDAGAPIGAQVDDIGEAGIDALRPQISRSYDRATDGVNVQLDPQYAKDIAPMLQQGAALSGDYGAGFSRLINNRVRPALDSGELTGSNYQNMTRAMRDSRGSVKGQPFAEDYIEPVKGMEDATRALMQRQGGKSVISGLNVADEAYRNSKVLGSAIESGKNTDGVFMPSQLNNASVANARKFGGNGATENRPFRDLAMQGQAVLPSKLADSGTPFRIGIGAGGLTGLTGGAGYLSGGDPTTTAAPIAATGLLALLGTKKGQQLLVKGLMDRPKSAKKLSGIFGSRKARRAISGAGAGLLLAGQ